MSHEEELLGVLTRVADALERSNRINQQSVDYIRERDAAAAERQEEATTSGEAKDSEWREQFNKRLELDRQIIELQERSLAKEDEQYARWSALTKGIAKGIAPPETSSD